MSGDDVTMRRKSYDHLIRTRDRALMNVEWEKRSAEHAMEWAHQQFVEQRRLSARLNAVCVAAAAAGVSIHDINAALADADSLDPASSGGTIQP